MKENSAGGFTSLYVVCSKRNTHIHIYTYIYIAEYRNGRRAPPPDLTVSRREREIWRNDKWFKCARQIQSHSLPVRWSHRGLWQVVEWQRRISRTSKCTSYYWNKITNNLDTCTHTYLSTRKAQPNIFALLCIGS